MFQITEHNSEWFGIPLLYLSQTGNRSLVRGITNQMIASDSFSRNNLSTKQ
jgi:hypothetical protein